MMSHDGNAEVKRIAREALLVQRLRNLFRIDEHLAIDLSYITHAEYQLFLDEKRFAGEYFQPDHWSSYTFPKGHGHLPVVGVRPADAAAYCEWLTQHDETTTLEGWYYRLPQPDELETYGLHVIEALGTVGGYWVRTNDNFVFTPIGKRMPILTMTRLQQKIEEDLACVPDSDPTLARALNHAVGHAYQPYHDHVRVRFSEHALDHARVQALEQARAGTFIDLNRAFVRARVDTLNLDLDRALVLVRDHALPFALALDHAPLFGGDPAFRSALVRDFDYTLACALALALACDRSLLNECPGRSRRIYLRFILIFVASQLLTSYAENIQALGKPWLDIYIDWVILEERIAGTLPAFEGIRIVKERVKE